MNSHYIYINGQFLSEENAVISVKTHALHYGTGCFEGIRAYYNENEKSLVVFRMKEHYERMLHSCKLLFIDLGKTIDELCNITSELLKKNFEDTDMYIRPLAFKSDKAVGNFNLKTLADSLVIYTTPLGRYLDTSKGIRAKVASWTRVADNMIPPRGKITGSYMNTALAKTEALLDGYEEALFMDHNNHIVEGSAENIFLVRGDAIYTPAASDDILQGITKNTIITLLENELGKKVVERSIDRSEVYMADEIFLVGTGAEVTPVIEIDHRKIGTGHIGNLTKHVKDLYFDIVHGYNKKYSTWTTVIKA